MTFTQNGGPGSLLAVALEDGSIQLFNASDGHLQRVLQTSIPIIDMTFSSDDLILVAMADRASLYRLFLFNIQIL